MHRRLSCFWGLCAPALGLALLLTALALLAVNRQTAVATQSEVCGPISTSTTWTLAQSPYRVTCDAALAAGTTLDVEPGVEVHFAEGMGLVVSGTLVASGTPSLPITFTWDQAVPDPGHWSGLRFAPGSSDSVLSWCTIEHATTGVVVYAMAGHMVSPTIADCTVRDNAGCGIQIEGTDSYCGGGYASPSILRCVVENNGEAGIYYHGSGSGAGCASPGQGVAGGTLSNSTIRYNLYGIRLNAEKGYQSRGSVLPTLDGNRIAGNTESGILIEGEDPVQAAIQNNLIYGNGASGIDWTAGDPDSDSHIVNNTIAANGQDGIMCHGDVTDDNLIQNNILAANGRYGLSCGFWSSPTLAYNDAWDNGLGTTDICDLGAGNQSADPRLVDASAADFRLELGSPCIDSGADGDAPLTDFDGVPRPKGSAVDMGAYEFWSPEIEVRQGAAELGQGSNLGYGRVQVGDSRAVSITIANLGNRALTVDEVEVWPTDHYHVAMPGGLPLVVGTGAAVPFDLEFVPRTTGEFSATVTIASDDPDEALYRFTVSGTGVQPIQGLTLSGPKKGLVDRSYTFTALVQPPTTTLPVTIVWSAVGQSPLTSTGGLSDTASFSWGERGPQLVTATAENAVNRLAASHTITLYELVESDFEAIPTRGLPPLTVHFSNQSHGDYAESLWDFGDRVTSTLTNPVHTYSAVGSYTVGLQVCGPGGSDEFVKVHYIVVDNYRMYLPLLRKTGREE